MEIREKVRSKHHCGGTYILVKQIPNLRFVISVIVLSLGKITEGNFCLAFHLFCPVISVISAEEETRTKKFFSCPWAAVFLTQIIFKCLFPVVEVYCPTVSITMEYYEANKKFVRLFVLWFCERWSFGRDKLQKSQMLRMKQGASSRERKIELILPFNPISLRSKWAVGGKSGFLIRKYLLNCISADVLEVFSQNVGSGSGDFMACW